MQRGQLARTWRARAANAAYVRELALELGERALVRAPRQALLEELHDRPRLAQAAAFRVGRERLLERLGDAGVENRAHR